MVLKVLFYGAYALLLILLAVLSPLWLCPVVLTSVISFGLVSLFRKVINAPRPYELTGKPPVLPKKTCGQSFPSRHVFSAFLIASCWWPLTPWASLGLFIAAIAIAVIRVIGGVHFPRDVIAGALIGIGCAALGLGVPWALGWA